MKNLENRVKRIEDELSLSPTIVGFDWAGFSERDKSILEYLLQKGREGDTTTNIAEALEFKDPEFAGRVKIYRSLKRIERISRKLKGLPIVIYERKKWSLAFDDYQFIRERTATNPE